MRYDYMHTINSYSPKFIKLVSRLTRFLEISLRFSVNGIDNIPTSGPAILLMNHSAVAVDGMLLNVRFLKEKGRIIRSLISKNMRRHIFLRESVMLCGGVDANASNALELLKQGELLLIYPGGPKEGLKDDKMRYKLIWDGEYGFIKLALKTWAPVVPIASIGLDENFHLISDGTFINDLLFGPKAFLLPIFRPSRIIPKKVTLHVGEPITFSHPPEASKDKKLVHRLQQQVKDVLEEMITQHIGQ